MRKNRSSAKVMHRAGELRKEPTPAEALLWSHLRGNRLRGVNFRRQHAIGAYVADFCSPKRKLIVEIDGSPHRDRSSSDVARTVFLVSQGYRVLRFWNRQVMKDVEGVLRAILDDIEEH